VPCAHRARVLVVRVEELRTFVAVVDAGGITYAVPKLDVVQSTVSDRINSLEKFFKAPLFDRRSSPNLMKLTDQGRRLLATARKVVALADELEAIRDLPAKEQAHTVRLGVNETVAHTWLFAWLARLRSAHPKLAFELIVDTTDALENLMLKRRLDFAAAARGFADPRIKKQRLSSLAMSFVGRRQRHTKREYELGELAREGFVTFSADTQPHSQLIKLLARRGIEGCRIDRISSIAAMIRAVESGLGVATLPTRVVEGMGHSAQLRVLPCAHGLAPLPLWLSWTASGSKHGALVRQSLVHYLREASWLKAAAASSRTE